MNIDDPVPPGIASLPINEVAIAVSDLVQKAQALVDLLEDAETNHGGLIGTKTLTAKNVLRMELSRWK